MEFLSERNIEIHREYLNNLICRYRTFEKSYPDLSGKDIGGIYRLKIQRVERESAIKLYSEILVHKIYFDSFSKPNVGSARLRDQFGSVASFLYEVRMRCAETEYGFLLVYENNGKICMYCGCDYEKVLRYNNVILALDLCEHAYFYDYGFNRDDYVINATSQFDLSKI